MNTSSLSRGVVVQVNISSGGVPKLPIARALVSELGIEGDKHLYRLHGGSRKALLLMAAEVIDSLRDEGFAAYYGALGENLTVRGLLHEQWQPGQRYQVGTVMVELTEPRVPCRKLKPYGPGIVKRLKQGSGYYASVIERGEIQPGDTIQMVDQVVSYARPRHFD